MANSLCVAGVNGTFIAYQRPADTGIHREVRLVLNWFEDLKRIAPPTGR
jgi:hypothetical protein